MIDYPWGFALSRLDAKLVAFDPDYPVPLSKCQPDEVTAWWNQEMVELASTKTSLLPLTCPDAWSTVATYVRSTISTQVMCCPS